MAVLVVTPPPPPAVAAAAAAAAAAARSAGWGGKNFLMISLGNFSRGSWCHLVGTGGGTVIEEWGGFSKSSVRLGFSELAEQATLSKGSQAGRLRSEYLKRSLS